MRVLHYSLGLPPYRSGGLTKYSCDLMIEQAKQGNEVYLLFPGKIEFLNDTTKIKKYTNYNNIKVYELINPLPVPLLNGIISPIHFMKKCNKTIFTSYLESLKVDIVHVHTFMGLYKEFLEACKELNIKVVYTTHDYFGFCNKVNFIDNNGQLCEKRCLEKCVKCNFSGDSLRKIKILQSHFYRFIKNKGLIEKLKKGLSLINNGNIDSNNKESKIEHKCNKEVDYNSYIKLFEYYDDMYRLIDEFLFNSELTKNIYNSYLKCKGNIVPITHANIKDNRSLKIYDKNKLKLTYLGPFKEYKGFFMLLNSVKELEDEGYNNIELNAYGDITNLNIESKNIKFHGKYSYDELKNIFDSTDILVVPSIWNETFGFIVLEALSYGTPVLVTSKVGSKDLVYRNNNPKGIIVEPTKVELKKQILNLYENPNILIKLNKNILKDDFNELLTKHYGVINSIYKKIIGVNKCDL